MYSKILVGVDGSVQSIDAVREGLKLAKLMNAELHALLVIHPKIYSQLTEREVTVHESTGEEHKITLIEQEEDEISAKIKEISDDAADYIQLHTQVGSAAEEILDFAEKNKIDLIIIGSTGKGMAGRLLLGSVSASVAEKSHINVLVTKPKEK